MNANITLLGTNSSMPGHGRFTSAQLVIFENFHVLIDCGEGAQIRMSELGIKRNKIDHILISHLHGDHINGLFGLLGSYMHFNRSTLLTIHGPAGINALLETYNRLTDSHYAFELKINELKEGTQGMLLETGDLQIRYFPLLHRITTFGFRFDYKKKERKMLPDVIQKYNLSTEEIIQAKKGVDLYIKGYGMVSHEQLSRVYEPVSYAYCSDTLYDERIVPYINGVNLLYHETTYLDDMEKEAKERMHSTLGQAIKIAKKANASKLLTGHYSGRYKDLVGFEAAAAKSSLEVIIGMDGMTYNI